MKKLVVTYAFALVALILSLTGCGKPVDPELQPYMDKFNDAASQRSNYARADGIGASFISDNGTAMLGHCQSGNIEIVRTDWDKLSENSKTQYMLHELGHCALHRSHLNTNQANGLPTSIMNKYGIGELYDANHKEAYLDELFTGFGPSINLMDGGK